MHIYKQLCFLFLSIHFSINFYGFLRMDITISDATNCITDEKRKWAFQTRAKFASQACGASFPPPRPSSSRFRPEPFKGTTQDFLVTWARRGCHKWHCVTPGSPLARLLPFHSLSDHVFPMEWRIKSKIGAATIPCYLPPSSLPYCGLVRWASVMHSISLLFYLRLSIPLKYNSGLLSLQTIYLLSFCFAFLFFC